MNAEGTKCTVDSEAGVTALKLWESVYQTDKVAPTPAQVDNAGTDVGIQAVSSCGRAATGASRRAKIWSKTSNGA